MDATEVAVIGAGVVGLAVAREIALAGKRVTVLERHARPGTEQSTHNSGVVHSGIATQPGTLRARLCVEGNGRMFDACREWGVPIARTGTLVVAIAPPERKRLDRYWEWSRENGVPDVRRLEAREARELEPALGPIDSGLFAPSGGRVDAVGLVRSLERQLVQLGGEIRYSSGLGRARRADPRWILTCADGRELSVAAVINASGIECAKVAHQLGAADYRIYPCLGEYARVRPPKHEAVRSMIYGLPEEGYPGIGVHLTRGMDGSLLVGPTATYLATAEVPTTRLTSVESMATEARRLLPDLGADDLEPHPPGLRAKPVPPGSSEPFADFVIREDPEGSGAFQLIGIESPGLTASLAIGVHVRGLVERRGASS